MRVINRPWSPLVIPFTLGDHRRQLGNQKHKMEPNERRGPRFICEIRRRQVRSMPPLIHVLRH